MKLLDIFEEVSSGNKLYHATKLEHYESQLKGDFITASMIHRFWADGRRHDRGDPEHENHVWIKGISLSRDLRFCLKWNFLIFELDQTKLKQRYKLLPVTWFSKKAPNRRREAEEFLWMDTSELSGDGANIIKYADNGKVKLTNLHKYCHRLIISKHFFDHLPDSSKDTILKNCKEYAEKYNLPLEFK